MRHGKKINHLGRKKAHRDAMLANMANSLIMHKRIATTVAKAKALRVYIEPLVTKSKEDSTNSRRVVFSYLQNKEAVAELFREVSTKIMNRPGGYTRILKTGNRMGDNAEMCIIEFVDYNENMITTKETKTEVKKTRRRKSTTKKETSDEVKDVAEKPKAPKAKVKPAAEEKTEDKPELGEAKSENQES